MPPDKLAEWACVRDAVGRGQSFVRVETQRRRRDGTLVDLLVSAAPLTDGRGVVRSMVLLFEDVTVRNRIEAARQKALRKLTVVYEVGRLLSAELDLERLLQALTDAATQLAGAEFGAFLYDRGDADGGHALYAISGLPRDAFAVPGGLTTLATAFSDARVLRLDDARRDTRWADALPPGGMPAPRSRVASCLAVPVVGRGGEVFGGLVLGHSQPGVFTEESERVVAGLAAHAAVAIDNARLYDAERRARSDAEAANRAKDEFLAMLGHELRNPLSAVRNAIIAARLDPERRDRALDVARRGAEQLGRLVDDLLDVARITQGRIALRRERLSFAGVVERAVEASRTLVAEHAHALTVALPGPEVQVVGDTTRLEQVVANLLANAAKYSDPGGRITVTAAAEGDEVVLRVRDEGVGIAPETLPRVFDLFYQSGRALDRAQGGLGVGLTVVKRLVELHGGRVEARSEGLGHGAEFVVRLPAVVPAADGAAADAAGAVRRREGARVLLVEDNDDVADSLTMLLELLGHRVRVAPDGPSALEAARTNVPDVMLVDIGLPGIDGYEVARRVRADDALRGVVLVALTGYGREEDRARALAAGFDHHLVKPVDPDTLQGLVAEVSAAREPRRGPLVH